MGVNYMPKRKNDWRPKEKRTHLICKDCKEELLLNMFIKKGFLPSGLQKYNSRCKPCAKKHNKQNWESEKLVQENLKYVQDIKVNEGCKFCGYDKCPCSIDFHHIKRDEKNMNISAMVYAQKPLELIKEEMEKCIVLCSNCHRELHYNETLENILDS